MDIFNTYDQLCAAGGGVAIVPAYMPGRRDQRSGWNVLRISASGKEIATDKQAAWYNYDKKHFGGFGTLAETLVEAQAWVAEQGWYSGKWMRNRMRDYVPKDINKKFPLIYSRIT